MLLQLSNKLQNNKNKFNIKYGGLGKIKILLYKIRRYKQEKFNKNKKQEILMPNSKNNSF